MDKSPCAARSTPPRRNASSVKSRIGARTPGTWTTNWKSSPRLSATSNSDNQANKNKKESEHYVKEICILHRHLARPGRSHCRSAQNRKLLQQRHLRAGRSEQGRVG